MTPAVSIQTAPGLYVLDYRCEGCGRRAPYGEQVDIRAALRTKDASKAGRFWCGRHKDGSLYCREAEYEGS